MEAKGGGGRIGDLGATLATAGAFAFAAFAPVSIALFQVSAGLAFLGTALAITSGRWTYRPTPIDLPLLIFIAVDLLSAVFAVDRARAFRCIKGDWILVFLPIFAQAVRSSRDVRRAFGILLASSTLVAAYAIAQMFTGIDLLRHRGLEPVGGVFIAVGLFGHHLTYGGSVLITSSLAIALAAGAQSSREKLTGGLAAFVQIGGVVASFARTAWAGLLVAVASVAFSVRGWVRRAAIVAIVGGAAAAVAIPPIRVRLSDVLTFGDDPRVRLWRTALRIWAAHPILGAGPGSFKSQFPNFKVPGTYMATGHPHNDILNILVQSGIIGLAAFVYLWIRYFRDLAGARRRLADGDPRRVLLLAGIVVVATFFVGGLGQCFLTDEEVGCLFWFIAAMGLVVAREVRDGI
jgi:O-antigen ligase